MKRKISIGGKASLCYTSVHARIANREQIPGKIVEALAALFAAFSKCFCTGQNGRPDVAAPLPTQRC
jgi:hypothetical protein